MMTQGGTDTHRKSLRVAHTSQGNIEDGAWPARVVYCDRFSSAGHEHVVAEQHACALLLVHVRDLESPQDLHVSVTDTIPQVHVPTDVHRDQPLCVPVVR